MDGFYQKLGWGGALGTIVPLPTEHYIMIAIIAVLQNK